MDNNPVPALLITTIIISTIIAGTVVEIYQEKGYQACVEKTADVVKCQRK